MCHCINENIDPHWIRFRFGKIFKIPGCCPFFFPAITNIRVVTCDSHHPAFFIEESIKMRLRRICLVSFSFPRHSVIYCFLCRFLSFILPIFTWNLRLFFKRKNMIKNWMINWKVNWFNIWQYPLHFSVKILPFRLTPKIIYHK